MKARLSFLTALVVLGCVMCWRPAPSESLGPGPVAPQASDERPQTIEDIPNSHGEVIVAFTASWCGPCQRDKPLLNRIAQTRDVLVVDVSDKHPGFAIPLYVVYQDGVEVGRTNSVEEL